MCEALRGFFYLLRMKYKDQLYVILGFISVRILTLALITYYQALTPGIYTPYIYLLCSVCDMLVVLYLYRFTKVISLLPFVLLALCIIYREVLEWFIYPLDDTGMTLSEVALRRALLIALPALIILISEIIIAVQLLKNKATGALRIRLRLVGWSYLLVIFFGVLVTVLSMWLKSNTLVSYTSTLHMFIPFAAMLLLYSNELRHYNDTDITSVVDQYI